MAENEFDSLKLVEDIAAEQAYRSQKSGIQINGFAEPHLPRVWLGNSELIRLVLGCLVEDILSEIENGAVMIEALDSQPVTKSNYIRFAVTDSRTDLTATQLKEKCRKYQEKQCNGHTIGELLKSLNTTLTIDERLLGRASRFLFSPDIHVADTTWLDFPLVQNLLEAKFFLVSNDPYPNRAIQRYCRHYGLHMEGAPTATESLTVLGNAAISEPFDIIGIAPPIEDMSSIDLAKTIRSSDHLSGVKMFYVAEQNCSNELDRAMAAGFDTTIERPFRKDDLFMTLAGLVGMNTFKQACPVVLIVEDNAVNQKVETFIMRLLGFESLTVSNGKEALEALEQRDFVAVLMDLQMPVMDGIEATRIIRQREDKKHIPIIALTANSDWKEDAMNAGCDEFIVKPASKELIKLALGKHLPTIIPGTEFQERKAS